MRALKCILKHGERWWSCTWTECGAAAFSKCVLCILFFLFPDSRIQNDVSYERAVCISDAHVLGIYVLQHKHVQRVFTLNYWTTAHLQTESFISFSLFLCLFSSANICSWFLLHFNFSGICSHITFSCFCFVFVFFFVLASILTALIAYTYWGTHYIQVFTQMQCYSMSVDKMPFTKWFIRICFNNTAFLQFIRFWGSLLIKLFEISFLFSK